MTKDKDDDTNWVTIDLDEDHDGMEDVENDDVENDEDDSDEDDSEDEKKQDKEGGRKSRAQDRIRQLVAERKALEEAKNKEIEELRKQMEQFQNSESSSKKEALENQKSLIDNQVEMIKDGLKRAYEDGDHEKILELQDQLSDLKLNQKIIANQQQKLNIAKPKTEEKQTEAKQTETQKQIQMPDEMQYWLEENPWALKPETREDRKKVRAVRRLSAELYEEGYDETSPEFYEELDKALEKEFGKSGQDDVEYDEDTTKGRPSSEDVKKRKGPVSGNSRTPARRRDRVYVSPEEKAIAKRLNIPEDRYALRKKKREAENSGWTTIVD